MNSEKFELSPVASLCDRYKLSKSVISKRMKDLSVRSQRISIHAYITSKQLRRLDALHEFIQGGGSTAEFLYFYNDESEDES